MTEPVVLRAAGAADVPALARLAALGSKRVPHGRVLVAEVGGELRAAVAVGPGAAPCARRLEQLRREPDAPLGEPG
ncbi:MAG TPA: hypothetical protein VHF51_20695 [Solirubrobacteraceae bacterium]|nr:hypothetical protein [Solirubrobacteraceae bacterium]